MKKRVFTILLALCMAVGLFAVPASAEEIASGTCGENLTWVLTDDGTLTISGEGEMDSAPWHTYKNSIIMVDIQDGVTSIYDCAFDECEALKKVVMADSVTTVGRSAFFDCISLEYVNLSRSITSWGMGSTFNGCSNLVKITIPEGITEIPHWCFYRCSSLTEVLLPDSLLEIDPYAFMACNNLATINIPNNLTYIGNSALAGAYGITTLSFPASLSNIDRSAFSGCSSLTEFKFLGNVPNIGENAFREVVATAYYPSNNPAWTSDVMQDYGGTLTWVPYTPNPFTDVSEKSFCYEPVLWAVENNITKGLTDTTFGPNESCTRGQVVTFLWRAAGSPEPTSTEHSFVDVSEKAYYYKAMLWAVENGITKGTDGTHFSPNAVCSRGTVVTFLHRAKGAPAPTSTEHSFTDISEKAFYYKAVLWAVENGITKGLTSTTFGPNESCNRGQVVTFLYRAYND